MWLSKYTKKGIKTTFDKIITSEEVKFNDLEKKFFYLYVFWCLIIKLLLEKYYRKLMNSRDKKKYRHKGLWGDPIKTVMGEVQYKRTMYEINECGIKNIMPKKR